MFAGAGPDVCGERRRPILGERRKIVDIGGGISVVVLRTEQMPELRCEVTECHVRRGSRSAVLATACVSRPQV
jgi:hypothetical protein